jgi:hypothetical protein
MQYAHIWCNRAYSRLEEIFYCLGQTQEWSSVAHNLVCNVPRSSAKCCAGILQDIVLEGEPLTGLLPPHSDEAMQYAHIWCNRAYSRLEEIFYCLSLD